jgi:hypothetical protein
VLHLELELKEDINGFRDAESGKFANSFSAHRQSTFGRFLLGLRPWI